MKELATKIKDGFTAVFSSNQQEACHMTALQQFSHAGLIPLLQTHGNRIQSLLFDFTLFKQ